MYPIFRAIAQRGYIQPHHVVRWRLDCKYFEAIRQSTTVTILCKETHMYTMSEPSLRTFRECVCYQGPSKGTILRTDSSQRYGTDNKCGKEGMIESNIAVTQTILQER